MSASLADEPCQLPCSELDVFDVENSLGVTPKETGHSFLQNLPSRAQEWRPRRQSLAQREQVVLVAPSAVQEEQRHGPGALPSYESVHEIELRGRHPPCPAVAWGKRSGGSARSICSRYASYIGGSFSCEPSSA